MVDIPAPKPAQVIRYAYLWADEHEEGREEGIKDRPAAVAMAVKADDGIVRVAVLPITHTPPRTAADGLEIPRAIKKHLGLDDAPSWVVLTEINVFAWPGPDLRPIPSSDPPTVLYGTLPSGFFRQLRDSFVASARARKVRKVPRTE